MPKNIGQALRDALLEVTKKLPHNTPMKETKPDQVNKTQLSKKKFINDLIIYVILPLLVILISSILIKILNI